MRSAPWRADGSETGKDLRPIAEPQTTDFYVVTLMHQRESRTSKRAASTHFAAARFSLRLVARASTCLVQIAGDTHCKI
jgi:hypothetical protein